MNKSAFLTGELVEKVFEILPEELPMENLSAFILTLTERYAGETPSKGVSLLLTTAVVYARAMGASNEKIRAILHSTAGQLTERKVH